MLMSARQHTRKGKTKTVMVNESGLTQNTPSRFRQNKAHSLDPLNWPILIYLIWGCIFQKDRRFKGSIPWMGTQQISVFWSCLSLSLPPPTSFHIPFLPMSEEHLPELSSGLLFGLLCIEMFQLVQCKCFCGVRWKQQFKGIVFFSLHTWIEF